MSVLLVDPTKRCLKCSFGQAPCQQTNRLLDLGEMASSILLKICEQRRKDVEEAKAKVSQNIFHPRFKCKLEG
jgi:hypothetical protein